MSTQVTHRILDVVRGGTCTGCGACAALRDDLAMRRSERGPIPDLTAGLTLPPLALEACPGIGIHYPTLYRNHFGGLPVDWRIGHVERMWTGYAADPEVRRVGASGGVTSRVLIHLLESGRVDGVVVARQGTPNPEDASWHIARSREEILACAQSVYIPVSMLDALKALLPGERYAMTCVPDQSAALRILQHGGHAAARQIAYVLGPYTGTALYPAAIRTLLRSKGVKNSDVITSLKWRAGEWPGYLEVKTASGRVIRSKKVYYNFLIPFFVTHGSLQSMDFANEFTDLSVGDAWSPKFEALGAGFSVITARTKAMGEVIGEMAEADLIVIEAVDPFETSSMHGHMIDFKKRGGYLRNQWRKKLGMAAPDCGLRPKPIGLGRIATETVISAIFLSCGNPLARKLLEWLPESLIGPLFNRLRLLWKSASKPVKRKGLGALTMVETPNRQRPEA